MKTYNILTLISLAVTVGLGFVIAWATSLDYSAPTASMIPLGIAIVSGIATATLWGSAIGSFADRNSN
jgi:hypothetical protein